MVLCPNNSVFPVSFKLLPLVCSHLYSYYHAL
jgi:hypothetical protein